MLLNYCSTFNSILLESSINNGNIYPDVDCGYNTRVASNIFSFVLSQIFPQISQKTYEFILD